MRKNYLTDSDEEAIVDLVKDHEELYIKTNEHYNKRPGRMPGGGSSTAASCLSRCATLGLNLKGLTTANSLTPSLVRLRKNDREAELDCG